MNPLIAMLRRPLLHVAAFSFLVNLMLLVPALFMLQVFDRVLASQSGATLLMLMIGAGIALALMLAFDYLRGRLQGVAGNLVSATLSPVVAEVMLAARARGGDGAPAEGLRDVATLRNLFSAQGLLALFDAPWLLVYLAVIWVFHPVLGIAATVAAASMLLLALLNDRITRPGIEALQREAAQAGRYLEASLANAEAVQAMGMAPALIGRWRKMNHKVTDLQRPVAQKSVAMASLTRALRQSIQIVILAVGAYLVITHEATGGVMIATTILLGRALAPVEQVVGSWRVLAEGRAALARLGELLDTAANAPPRMPLPEPLGALEANGIVYRPPGSDRFVLQGVSLRLAPGESLAIVGPSAAGKSTLVRVLAGLWKPTAGMVRLDGADLSQWPRETLGPSIGYVPQDVELFQGTVAENIARLGQADTGLVVSAARRAGVHDMILTLPDGYDTKIDSAGVLLSPGQRQRIALARALYGDPRLVILDEPNSNLDSVGERALADAILELRRRSVTVIVVTHRNALVRHMTQMLVLDAGRVQQYGPIAGVLIALDRQRRSAPPGKVVRMTHSTQAPRKEQAS